MSLRSNGSYIGPRPTGPSSSVASGIWNLQAVHSQRRDNAWPGQPITDANFSSVSLLLHMDGSGSTFTDSSGTPKTITANGNATQSTTQSKFGGKSAYFDGSGDYLTISSEDSFDLGSSDWTIECWAYTSRTTGDQGGFFSKRSGPVFGGVLLNHYGSSGNLQFLASTDNSTWAVNFTASAAMPTNTWAHFAVVRNGSSVKLYVDGVEKGSGTLSGAIAGNSSAFVVGAGDATGGDAFTGYIDEFRVSSIARYTGNFTPSTTAFPNS